MADDFLSPTDPIVQFGMNRGLATPIHGLASAHSQAGLVPPSPEYAQRIQQGAQRLGVDLRVPDDPPRLELYSLLVAPHGRNPLVSPFQSNVPDDTPDYVPAPAQWDPIALVKHGFHGSFLGSLQAWSGLNGAMNFKNDPGFDPFGYKPIHDSPWRDDWHLFAGARSAEEADWILRRLSDQQREGDRIGRMQGAKGAFELVGGLLGDPLAVMPTGFGAKMALTAALGGGRATAFGLKQITYGGLNDALRASSVQAGLMLSEHYLQRGMDPTVPLTDVADLLALPVVIAASANFAGGAYARFSTGLNALRDSSKGGELVGGARPAGRRFSHDGPVPGPGPATPEEVAHINERINADEASRFAVAGVVQRVQHLDGEEHYLVELAHGPVVSIPSSEIDKSSTGAGGVVVSGSWLKENEIAMGSAYAAGGDFRGGGRPKVMSAGEALMQPGALASNYEHVRAYELAEEGTRVPPKKRLGEPTSEKMLADPQLERMSVRDMHPNVFDGGQEAMIVMPDGQLFKLHHVGFEDDPRMEVMQHPDGGQHALFSATYPELHSRIVKLTRYRDEIAGDIPADGGFTIQQEATVRRIQAAWDREVKGHKAMLGLREEPSPDVEISKGSLSAAAPRTSAHKRAMQLEANRMVATGIGVEKLGLNMVDRIANSPFTTAQHTIEDLVSGGGRVRQKNVEGMANALPVETIIKHRWNKPMVDSIRGLYDGWIAYRKELAGEPMPAEPMGDYGRVWNAAKIGVKDRLNKGEQGLSFEAFRRRVGDAWINADKDLRFDSATPHVEKAASGARGHFNDLRDQADEVGLFRDAYDAQIEQAKAAIGKLKKEGAAGEDIGAAERRLSKLEGMADRLRRDGPTVNTARSYRPRYWLVGQLMERQAEFVDMTATWLQRTAKLDRKAAEHAAEEVHAILTKQKPLYEKEEIDNLFESVAEPMSARARTFEIPDELAARHGFLENDAEVLLRSHTRQMGTAIEMQRRFGSTGLEEEVREIHREAQLLIEATPDRAQRSVLAKQRDLAITDLQAARDRLYGTYGAAADPHRWQSRLVRMAKQYTNLSMMGMAGVTALGDLVRPAMTEGLQAMHHYGFQTLMSESRASILKMSRKELELAGDATELISNMRALSMSDTGDIFQSRTGTERWLHQANQYFFVANGLNSINQLDKEWAGVIIQGRVNAIAMRLANGGKLTQDEITRFAAHGIDDIMLKRIGLELKEHGEKFKSITMANTEKWTDEVAQQHYRVALNQMVNRTVPTPGFGDAPNWFSSELGGLIAQYKSFATGAMIRTLYSGLQEGGSRFWYGAAMATGFGMLLNEMRSRLFYDRSTGDRPLASNIVDGIDRASLLGWFTDADRAIEILTGHRVGVKAWAGDRPHTDDMATRVGALVGPAASQAVRAGSVLQDVLSGHPVAKTFADTRKLAPGGNLPYLDPFWDHTISDGNWRRDTEAIRAVNRQEPRH